MSKADMGTMAAMAAILGAGMGSGSLYRTAQALDPIETLSYKDVRASSPRVSPEISEEIKLKILREA